MYKLVSKTCGVSGVQKMAKPEKPLGTYQLDALIQVVDLHSFARAAFNVANHLTVVLCHHDGWLRLAFLAFQSAEK
jgi:hypothetical protein